MSFDYYFHQYSILAACRKKIFIQMFRTGETPLAPLDEQEGRDADMDQSEVHKMDQSEVPASIQEVARTTIFWWMIQNFYL